MIENTISAATARRLYDHMGRMHDWAEHYEGRAKHRAMERLALAPGLRVLNVGAGTGQEHRILQAAVQPGGIAVGLDISTVMLGLIRQRTGAPVLQADTRHLPLADAAFDRLFCAYVLDLMPASELTAILRELGRVVRPGGRLVTVSLTEGVDASSRAFIAAWKAVYRIDPELLGGCRPLRLADFVHRAGIGSVESEVAVQLGVPSEIVTVHKAAL